MRECREPLPRAKYKRTMYVHTKTSRATDKDCSGPLLRVDCKHMISTFIKTNELQFRGTIKSPIRERIFSVRIPLHAATVSSTAGLAEWLSSIIVCNNGGRRSCHAFSSYNTRPVLSRLS